MLNNFNKKNKGFTILEAIFTFTIIVVGFSGVMTLILKTARYSQINNYNLVAAYLAQEGLELVRNIRDSNWLAGKTGDRWREGIDNRSYIIDYNDNSLRTGSPNLYIDASNGFYSHDNSITNTKTIFQRVISISTPSSDCKCILASSTVTWSDFGITRSITVSERLYNWFQP
jgi:type II secretory pathway pseudopilin PulG